MKEGWEVEKLGDICDILDSKRKPITKKNRVEGDIPYYGATGVLSYVKDHLFDEQLVLLGEDGAKWESGDSSAFIITGKTWVNNHAHVLRPHRDRIKDQWLVYNLNGQDLMPFISGMTVPKLNQKNMRQIPVPIPPLEEQKQIVAVLDKAFAAIDQAKANIEKNLQNAKELFQSKLNEIFTQKGEGWEEKILKEIGNTQTGSTPPTKDKNNYGTFIPFVKPAHFQDDGSIISGDSMLSEKGFKLARLFKEGSILMVCIGATIGKTGFSSIAVTSNQQINALTPVGNYEPKFFYYALLSKDFYNKVIHASSQATLPIINKSKWEKMTVSFPPEIARQKLIVSQLEKLKEQCKKLESEYQKKLNNLDELKKSILQKAFAGELVTAGSKHE